MKKILVTGGAGFIGSHVVDELIKRNYQVSIIDNLSTGKKENLNPKAKFYNLDIRDSKISEAFKKEKPNVVFHLGAHISVKDSVVHPQECSDINILGSINLVENFLAVNKDPSQCKFIFSSTGGAIYGNADILPTSEGYKELPISPYGVSKLAFEKYLNYYHEAYKLPFIALRYANVYGPRQDSNGEAGVVAIFANRILNNKKVIIHNDGKQTRDFVFVKDIVKANMLALKKDKTGVFNISSGKETDINTIYSVLKELSGLDSKKDYKELEFIEQLRSCLDNKKAREELGWSPSYSLKEGLRKTITFFRKNKS
jgi:UDP-glucose 4-epimerase